MLRQIRGLEDRETHDRKRLLRDVRSPSEKFADALKNGTVQLCGIGGAGVCLLAFPFLSLPMFLLACLFFVLRCVTVNAERLPFRMPIGLSGTDKGDPLPGRGGFATPEGIFFLGNSSFSLYLPLVFVKIDSKLHLISRKPYKSDVERHYLKS